MSSTVIARIAAHSGPSRDSRESARRALAHATVERFIAIVPEPATLRNLCDNLPHWVVAVLTC